MATAIINSQIDTINSTLSELGDDIENFGTAIVEQLGAVSEILYSQNLLAHKNIYKTTAGTLSYVMDTGGITITNEATGNYAAKSTYDGWTTEVLTVGKKYRVHAKAEAISGSPFLYVAIRGVAGNANAIVNGIQLNSGEDGYFEFTMNSNIAKLSLFMSWTSSTKDSVARYSELWVQEVLDKSAVDDCSRTAIENIEKGNAFSFSLPRCYFWGRQTILAGGTFVDSDQNTVSEVFKFVGNVKIISTTPYALIRLWDEDLADFITPWGSQLTAYANKNYRLLITTSDMSDFTAPLIDDVKFYADYTTYQQYLKDYRIKVDGSVYARGWVENAFDCLFDGYYWEGEVGMEGVRTRHTFPNRRATRLPVYCENDLLLVVGVNGDHTVHLYLGDNNTYETYTNSAIVKIPANTEFRLAMFTSNDSSNLGRNIMLIDTGSEKNGIVYHNISTGYQTSDSFVLTNSMKRILLSRKEQGYYTVIDTDGTVLTDKAAFDHNTEHCNSSNYVDGKVYISSFYGNPNEIFVFDFDEETNLLTYEKTISVVLPEGNSYTQYHVLKGEEQIIGLGWNDTTGIYSGAWIRYSVFSKKDDGTYHESIGVNLPWFRMYQSMCLFGNELTIVECKDPSEDYVFKTLRKVNIGTYLCEKSTLEPVGGIATHEVEGIAPLAKNVFLICDRNGRFYIAGYASE